MRTKLYISILFLCILCSCGNKHIAGKSEEKDSVSIDSAKCENKTDSCSETNNGIVYWDNLDTKDMTKYQTFDELTMKGCGKAVKKPFVYVLDCGDTIAVKSSYKYDKTRIYIRKAKDLWYSCMNFGEALWCKCEFSQGPTRYDRYFYNDSILEIRTLTFNDGDKETEIYLKHDRSLFIIKNTQIKSMPISKLRAMVNQATKHNSANVTRYELQESGTQYKYVSTNDTITYEKKKYGTWGIQPGVYETYLHQGRDIRILREEEEAGVSFNPNYDPSDPNKVYDVVSQMPSYHGGMTALMDFLVKHTKYPEEAKAKGIEGRVLVTFIVERDGSITDIEVVKSVEKSLDEEAIRVIKSMPKWKPGRENNTKVRCKYTLPVTFRLGK